MDREQPFFRPFKQSRTSCFGEVFGWTSTSSPHCKDKTITMLHWGKGNRRCDDKACRTFFARASFSKKKPFSHFEKILRKVERKRMVFEMMYTSYFAQLKNLPADVVPVAICGKSPEWYTGLQYKKVAPKYGFFMEWKRNHDNDDYVKHFNEEVLADLDPQEVYKEICQLAGSSNIVLLCYEKSGDFCHRHLVAKWFQEHGIPCEEWQKAA